MKILSRNTELCLVSHTPVVNNPVIWASGRMTPRLTKKNHILQGNSSPSLTGFGIGTGVVIGMIVPAGHVVQTGSAVVVYSITLVVKLDKV